MSSMFRVKDSVVQGSIKAPAGRLKGQKSLKRLADATADGENPLRLVGDFAGKEASATRTAQALSTRDENFLAEDAEEVSDLKAINQIGGSVDTACDHGFPPRNDCAVHALPSGHLQRRFDWGKPESSQGGSNGTSSTRWKSFWPRSMASGDMDKQEKLKAEALQESAGQKEKLKLDCRRVKDYPISEGTGSPALAGEDFSKDTREKPTYAESSNLADSVGREDQVLERPSTAPTGHSASRRGLRRHSSEQKMILDEISPGEGVGQQEKDHQESTLAQSSRNMPVRSRTVWGGNLLWESKSRQVKISRQAAGQQVPEGTLGWEGDTETQVKAIQTSKQAWGGGLFKDYRWSASKATTSDKEEKGSAECHVPHCSTETGGVLRQAVQPSSAVRRNGHQRSASMGVVPTVHTEESRPALGKDLMNVSPGPCQMTEPCDVVDALRSCSWSERLSGAAQLRQQTKASAELRKVFAEAGAVPALVDTLHSLQLHTKSFQQKSVGGQFLQEEDDEQAIVFSDNLSNDYFSSLKDIESAQEQVVLAILNMLVGNDRNKVSLADQGVFPLLVKLLHPRCPPSEESIGIAAANPTPQQQGLIGFDMLKPRIGWQAGSGGKAKESIWSKSPSAQPLPSLPPASSSVVPTTDGIQTSIKLPLSTSSPWPSSNQELQFPAGSSSNRAPWRPTLRAMSRSVTVASSKGDDSSCQQPADLQLLPNGMEFLPAGCMPASTPWLLFSMAKSASQPVLLACDNQEHTSTTREEKKTISAAGEASAAVLLTLSAFAPLRERMAAAGAIPPLVEVLILGSQQAQSDALRTLLNVSHTPRVRPAILCASKLLQALRNILLQSTEDAVAVERAVTLLKNLCEAHAEDEDAVPSSAPIQASTYMADEQAPLQALQFPRWNSDKIQPCLSGASTAVTTVSSDPSISPLAKTRSEEIRNSGRPSDGDLRPVDILARALKEGSAPARGKALGALLQLCNSKKGMELVATLDVVQTLVDLELIGTDKEQTYAKRLLKRIREQRQRSTSGASASATGTSRPVSPGASLLTHPDLQLKVKTFRERARKKAFQQACQQLQAPTPPPAMPSIAYRPPGGRLRRTTSDPALRRARVRSVSMDFAFK